MSHTLRASGEPRTPMLKQYLELKAQVPDCILFFRMGDFYETFFEDARITSRVLGIQLTTRDKDHPDPVPMAGVPAKALEAYLAKMVEAGFKVAVCDQVEDPKKAKGLVRREITRVVTPGMFISQEHLPSEVSRYLVALFLGREVAGLGCVELSTGEFLATELAPGEPLAAELARLEPAEVVIAETQRNHPQLKELEEVLEGVAISTYPGRPPSPRAAAAALEGFVDEGVELGEAGMVAAAMAWEVVVATQRLSPAHITTLEPYQTRTHMLLDRVAVRNLELVRSLAEGGRKGSLLWAVDRALTAMGKRLVRQWITFPLLETTAIAARHQAVEALLAEADTRRKIRSLLRQIPDLARLTSRLVLGQAGPREMAALREGLGLLPDLARELEGLDSELLVRQAQDMRGLEPLYEKLAATLVETPPSSVSDGGVIAEGVSEQLDRLRKEAAEAKAWIAALQGQLRQETGIASLKVGFNKVFGYYIEVTRTHLDKVPPSFIRKQTLAGAERFYTPELKEKEAAVLGAEERAVELEREIFERLREEVGCWARQLVAAARAVGVVDVLGGWAELAVERDYCRPQVHDGEELEIVAGRHPVVEQVLAPGQFVPNDVRMDSTQQILIITGPNMAGKSTILRQVALIVLLAHAGAFVPATRAVVPLTDRIFTRVGAMDELARGRSTFMVEMTETAQILAHATTRSLVILDEVGRGTSTFDGLALAWAVVEYLHELHGQGVKTLFATHYHELTRLAQLLPRVRNYNVAVKDHAGGVVFLHRLVPGGASKSYGISVAKLAGLPREVIERARQVLEELESAGPRPEPMGRGPVQLGLFHTQEHPVLKRLRSLDIHRITPLEALNLLDELKQEAEGEGSG